MYESLDKIRSKCVPANRHYSRWIKLAARQLSSYLPSLIDRAKDFLLKLALRCLSELSVVFALCPLRSLKQIQAADSKHFRYVAVTVWEQTNKYVELTSSDVPKTSLHTFKKISLKSIHYVKLEIPCTTWHWRSRQTNMFTYERDGRLTGWLLIELVGLVEKLTW